MGEDVAQSLGEANKQYAKAADLNKQIQKVFGKNGNIVKRKGYSILYPAWYRDRWTRKLGRRVSRFLWAMDDWLNKTTFWKFGEYTLFVIKKN